MAPSRPTRSLRLPAFAKINLSLRVLGTHADGYHELRTTFQSLALHDTLTFTRTRGEFALKCDDPACPVDRTNLVWRAAELLWRADRRRGRPQGVSVAIEKRIPMQAGLGGGSSDAAAALRGLSRLWKLPLGLRLRDLARELGADVAYFLEGGAVLGAGRGEILFPLAEPPAMFVVLVLPAFGVSTRDAYRWWDEANPQPLSSSTVVTSRPAGGETGNDLQPAVVSRHPEIGKIVKQLSRAGAVDAAMSGSGSAVFAVFSDESAAYDAADAVTGPGRRVLLTRTIGRREYQQRTALESREMPPRRLRLNPSIV